MSPRRPQTGVEHSPDQDPEMVAVFLDIAEDVGTLLFLCRRPAGEVNRLKFQEVCKDIAKKIVKMAE